MNTLRTRHVALGLSIAALAAAGCGSSSSSKSKPASGATSGLTPSTTGTTTTASPKGGFTAQLNTLCQQGNAAVAAATGTPAKVAAFDAAVKKFEALTPPAAQKAAYAQFIAGIKAESVAAKANNVAALKQANLIVKAGAAKLGAPHCQGK
ncbi:MAG TPA: hypothetical protein VMU90_09505 [Solirubrobacteraceae bacterium]|nr:hypothetical protein [Solirubrobacteraceae bacterium]